MRALRFGVALLWAALLCGCSSSSTDEPVNDTGGTRVLADYTLTDGFYAAPFPDDARLGDAGHPVLSGFPNPTESAFVEKMRELLERDARGFATTAGVFFSLDGALDPAVEADFAASLADDANVFLIDVDEGSPDRGKRMPVRVRFAADGGPFGAPNLLSLLPLQGAPLRPLTRYAAVVTRDVLDADGARLGVPAALQQIIKGNKPDGMSAAVFDAHRAALAELGVDSSNLAGLAVFTTDDPTRDLVAVRDAMLAAPLPAATGIAPKEVFDEFCVYEGSIEMPVFQVGTPPFKEDGGEWQFEADGTPIAQGKETARIVITLPRQSMPAAGFPVVIFSRTGGGGDRPLVDRGVQAETGGPALVPGSGPALQFARAGFAGVSVDGPHGGLRNITKGDEQFLMFNVTNPGALRDNVRQSAAEIALTAHVLDSISIDASACPDLESAGAKLDSGTIALMGHSMGATIAPLSLAIEPELKAGILSGAGGSWIENVMYKLKPVAVKGFAELILGVAGQHELTEDDPVLSLFQWSAEPADPPVYGRAIQDGTHHILMVQGIVDHYILPPIANTTSLSVGLDLGGDPLDAATPELSEFANLADMLQFSGRSQITLPASGNANGITRVVVQQKEDGLEDGHEVVFQTEPPKHQYQCFLQSLKSGVPSVPPPAGETAACP